MSFPTIPALTNPFPIIPLIDNSGPVPSTTRFPELEPAFDKLEYRSITFAVIVVTFPIVVIIIPLPAVKTDPLGNPEGTVLENINDELVKFASKEI